MHIEDIVWIVIEDGERISPLVKKLLKRSSVVFHYLVAEKQNDMPCMYNYINLCLRN